MVISGTAGSVTRNSVYWSSLDATIFPPCSSTISLAIAKDVYKRQTLNRRHHGNHKDCNDRNNVEHHRDDRWNLQKLRIAKAKLQGEAVYYCQKNQEGKERQIQAGRPFELIFNQFS